MRTVLLALSLALGVAGQARAAVITRTYTFTAGPLAAADAGVSGSVTVSFDPAVSVLARPGAEIHANVAVAPPVSYSYRRTDDTLSIVGGAAANDAFALVIHDAASDRKLLAGELSYQPADGALSTRVVKVVSRTGPARLPEPATWAMLVMGFGLIGSLARRRHRRSEAAFTERMRRIAAGEPD